MSELALIVNFQDCCEEATNLYRDVLERQISNHGEMHDVIRAAMTDSLPVYIRSNIIDEAIILSNRVIKVCEEIYGQESLAYINNLFHLSSVYDKAGKVWKSKDVKIRVLDLERQMHPSGHNETFYNVTNLAQCHYDLRELDEVIALQLEALEGYQQLDGDQATRIMGTTFALACSYHEAGKLDDARADYEQAINMSRTILTDKDETTIAKLSLLMALYTEIGEYELAKDLVYENPVVYGKGPWRRPSVYPRGTGERYHRHYQYGEVVQR
ncbi:MAG: hypothetical protein L6R41_005597 [Letrouitia leprolyta]|nr:MAG: hypothetical protein L6R41_005597 [Letrouitia leprolyta]